jgi:hypothetical protein
VLLDALDSTTSWQSWHYMRTSLDRSAGAAEKILMLSLHDLLVAKPTKR